MSQVNSLRLSSSIVLLLSVHVAHGYSSQLFLPLSLPCPFFFSELRVFALSKWSLYLLFHLNDGLSAVINTFLFSLWAQSVKKGVGVYTSQRQQHTQSSMHEETYSEHFFKLLISLALLRICLGYVVVMCSWSRLRITVA